MTDKLSLYNGALRELGQRKLASLSEARDSRRFLDDAWDDGAISFCLELGQWKFATRSVMLDFSPSITPGFGYTYAFDLPEDHVKLIGVWSDANMAEPLRAYRAEGGGYLYASIETIYISYVSNHTTYGLDYSRWPSRFTKVVEAHLAAEIALALTGDREKKGDMILLRDKMYLPLALSNDAQQNPTRFPPVGGWVRARMNGWRGGEFP